MCSDWLPRPRDEYLMELMDRARRPLEGRGSTAHRDREWPAPSVDRPGTWSRQVGHLPAGGAVSTPGDEGDGRDAAGSAAAGGCGGGGGGDGSGGAVGVDVAMCGTGEKSTDPGDVEKTMVDNQSGSLV